LIRQVQGLSRDCRGAPAKIRQAPTLRRAAGHSRQRINERRDGTRALRPRQERHHFFSPKVENHINVQGAAADLEAIGDAASAATVYSLSTWEDASMALNATDG
jgi:hypothetical protein